MECSAELQGAVRLVCPPPPRSDTTAQALRRGLDALAAVCGTLAPGEVAEALELRADGGSPRHPPSR
jgi:hypothetical protein